MILEESLSLMDLCNIFVIFMNQIIEYERRNRRLIEGYQDLNSAAQGLVNDSLYLSSVNADIKGYLATLDEVDDTVTKLSELVKEMDEWSKELVVKCSRLL